MGSEKALKELGLPSRDESMVRLNAMGIEERKILSAGGGFKQLKN